MSPRLTLLLVLTAACATTGTPSAGDMSAASGPSAGFLAVAVEKPSISGRELLDVCWPPLAPADARVALQFLERGEVLFEATDNSTGRCMREIATTYPWGLERPSGELELRPRPPSGWAVLAWAKLLAASRFGPERGLLDPGAHAAACLQQGPSGRAARYEVRFAAGLLARVPGGAVTEQERCVEAVLGAAAWPATREFLFELPGSGAPRPTGDDVSFYFARGEVTQAIDPQRAHDAMQPLKPAVGACWESALARRAGLSGGRTVRISVGDDGSVTHVAVAANATDARATASDYLLDRCLVAAVKTARFGPGAGDTAYSWVFGDRASR